VRARISIFVSIIQAILILVHLTLYETWMFFWMPSDSFPVVGFRIIFTILCVSFVAATLLAHQYLNWPVRVFYSFSAVWLGLVNFLFLSALACWIVYLIPGMFGVHLERRPLAILFLGLGLFAGICAMVNAASTRVKKITVKLPNLPASWRGRTAAMVSDLHLGHIRNRGFLRRIVKMLIRLKPDVLFIPGDMYDGTEIDSKRLSEPWLKFSAPMGAYFVTGNHEEFSSPAKYLETVKLSGIRSLENEKIVLDGLQIVGVNYRDSTHVDHFRSVVRRIGIDRDIPSIILLHTPDRLQTVADEGFSLQLSGHTHRGQFFPFTLIVKRIYREFAYGLHHLDDLAIYTSCGAGTWGPPMRLGSNPEIVLIHFE
jgi:predicted MPP superfamily phosphohydrolase